MPGSFHWGSGSDGYRNRYIESLSSVSVSLHWAASVHFHLSSYVYDFMLQVKKACMVWIVWTLVCLNRSWRNKDPQLLHWGDHSEHHRSHHRLQDPEEDPALCPRRRVRTTSIFTSFSVKCGWGLKLYLIGSLGDGKRIQLFIWIQYLTLRSLDLNSSFSSPHTALRPQRGVSAATGNRTGSSRRSRN